MRNLNQITDIIINITFNIVMLLIFDRYFFDNTFVCLNITKRFISFILQF